MSTFDGVVKEFPDIRIDYFRQSNQPTRPPLAYFLSHVHSDHLQGLESCKSPFIYCSPATREIILRLEKYPHRMNFAKGILESRKQAYKHLGKLLKTIPLKTPTVIDLAPGRSIRVTLFDANHCVGSVMFLIEDNRNAILYTGDIRSELWWVNALTCHPLLLPYAYLAGEEPIRRLDCIYLDTTFANKSDRYKHFKPKADGVTELLRKVAKYSENTVFYFDSWTFGYEDVWVALSSFLGCRVHLDQYRFKLYQALADGSEPRAEEAARLFGFKCGNHEKNGCLTSEQSRLHSCEEGTGCEVFDGDFVRITPIISRCGGVDMAELGAGGGQGDLDQQHELELDDTKTIGMLITLCASKTEGEPKLRERVIQMLLSLMEDQKSSITLDMSALNAANNGDMVELESMRLEDLVPALTKMATTMQERKAENAVLLQQGKSELPYSKSNVLPKRITFPYSRHSSYTELCYLIEPFKPKDIHPCTVDYAHWAPSQAMSFLFGHLYSPSETPTFQHDQRMFQKTGSRDEISLNEANGREQTTSNSAAEHQVEQDRDPSSSSSLPGAAGTGPSGTYSGDERPRPSGPDTQLRNEMDHRPPAQANVEGSRKRRRSTANDVFEYGVQTPLRSRHSAHSPDMSLIDAASKIRVAGQPLSPDAYSMALQGEIEEGLLEAGDFRWDHIELVSVSGHQEREVEL